MDRDAKLRGRMSRRLEVLVVAGQGQGGHGGGGGEVKYENVASLLGWVEQHFPSTIFL